MRFIISLCLALLFSTNGEAMNEVETHDISLMLTIQSEQSEENTRQVFKAFQMEYKESGILHPYGLGSDPDARMDTRKTQRNNNNPYLDQIAYQENLPIAYVNVGLMPVKGYEAHPLIAQAWRDLGFTDDNFNQKEGVGTGYIAFGFASNVSQETKIAVIKTSLGWVKNKAQTGDALLVQNRIPTHFVSLIALADEPLIQALKSAGFTLHNTEDQSGFPGFDSPDEKRNRLIAVYKLSDYTL